MKSCDADIETFSRDQTSDLLMSSNIAPSYLEWLFFLRLDWNDAFVGVGGGGGGYQK